MSDNQFGQLLEGYRKYRGLKQTVLARRLRLVDQARYEKLDDSTISRWERGSRKPPPRDTVLDLAAILELTDYEVNALLLSAGHADLGVEERNEFLRRTAEHLRNIADGVKDIHLEIEKLHSKSTSLLDHEVGESIATLPCLLSDPPAVSSFVGRKLVWDNFRTIWADNSKKIILIGGTPNIGKTCFVSKWTEEAAKTHRCLWVTFEGKTWGTIGDFLTSIATLVEDEVTRTVLRTAEIAVDAKLTEAIRLFQNAEEIDHPFAIFLDAYEQCRDKMGFAKLFKALATAGQSTKVVVASRSRPSPLEWSLPAGAYHEITLEGIEPGDARRMLTELGVAATEEQAQTIWERCGKGHPRVMELFAGRAKRRGLDTALQQLLSYSGEVASGWLEQEVWCEIPPDEQELLLMASVFTEPVGWETLAAYFGGPDANRLIDNLVDSFLISVVSPGTLVCDNLVREFCYNLKMTDEGRKANHRKAGAHLCQAAQNLRTSQRSSRWADWKISTQERWADLMWQGFSHLFIGEDWNGAVQAAHRVDDILHQWGHWDRSWLLREQALEASRNAGNKAEEAAWLLELGVRYQNQSEYAMARQFYQESLTIRQDIGDTRGIGGTLQALGTLARIEGDLLSARQYLDASLEIKRRGGDQGGIAWTLHAIGLVLRNQAQQAKEAGETERALDLYNAARAHFLQSLHMKKELIQRGRQQAKWTKEVAWTQEALATVMEGVGQEEQAKNLYEQSLETMQRYRDPRGIATNLLDLARISRREGDFEQSRRYHEKSLSINLSIGFPRGIVANLRGLGQTAEEEGNLDLAVNHYEQALRVAQRTGLPQTEIIKNELERVHQRLCTDSSTHTME